MTFSNLSMMGDNMFMEDDTVSGKQHVLAALHEGIVKIEFVKADDSVRTMQATLVSNFIPVDAFANSGKTKAHNPDVQAVWDTEANAWRSFRWDSLQTIDGKSYLNVQ